MKAALYGVGCVPSSGGADTRYIERGIALAPNTRRREELTAVR